MVISPLIRIISQDIISLGYSWSCYEALTGLDFCGSK